MQLLVYLGDADAANQFLRFLFGKGHGIVSLSVSVGAASDIQSRKIDVHSFADRGLY